MKPEISIITPVYNSERYLQKMINSVLKQSFSNWELILIDDKSTDRSLGIIKGIKDKRIRFKINRKNLGAGLSRNIGTKMSKGRYITFIDSDDFWDKDFLIKTLKFIKKNNYDFVFTSYFWTDKNGKVKGTFNVPKKVNYQDLLKTNPISCLTRMYDTKRIGKILSPKLKIRQDYVFCLKILKKIDYAYGLNNILGYRRLRNNSLSNNKFKSAFYQFKVYKDYENIGYFKSLTLLLEWFINGVAKHLKNYAN
jgi:teichuronic acid biosynthesis glycosyltransferase TuaG